MSSEAANVLSARDACFAAGIGLFWMQRAPQREVGQNASRARSEPTLGAEGSEVASAVIVFCDRAMFRWCIKTRGALARAQIPCRHRTCSGLTADHGVYRADILQLWPRLLTHRVANEAK